MLLRIVHPWLLPAVLICATLTLAVPLPGGCCSRGGVHGAPASPGTSSHSSFYPPSSTHGTKSPLFSHGGDGHSQRSESSQLTRTGSGSWPHGSHAASPFTTQHEHEPHDALPLYAVTESASARHGRGARVQRIPVQNSGPSTAGQSTHHSGQSTPSHPDDSSGWRQQEHGQHSGHGHDGAGPSTSGPRYSSSSSDSHGSGRRAAAAAAAAASRGKGIHIRD